jgi:hypothetical protein
VIPDPPSPDDGARHLVPVVHRRGPHLPTAVEVPLDVALGAAVTVARPIVAVSSVLGRLVAPVAGRAWSIVLRPPLVPERWTPASVGARLADEGRQLRFSTGEDATAATGQALDLLVPAVLEPVLDRLDLTGIVLERVDLEALVSAVLDSIDLTGVVLERVDLKRVVESALSSIDLTEVVRTQVDMASLAEEVIEEVNLPEIIRESSTGVATEVVDTARLSAVAGDELVNRWVDRLLLRRKARRLEAQGLMSSDRLDNSAEDDLARQTGDADA